MDSMGSRIGDPAPLTSADKGFYYKEILRLVNEAKNNLGTYFPTYNGGGVAYVTFTLAVVRPLLARCKNWFIKDDVLNEAGLVTGLARIDIAVGDTVISGSPTAALMV